MQSKPAEKDRKFPPRFKTRIIQILEEYILKIREGSFSTKVNCSACFGPRDHFHCQGSLLASQAAGGPLFKRTSSLLLSGPVQVGYVVS